MHLLNPKKELFVHGLLRGLSQADALRSCHSVAAKWKPERTYEMASRWARDPKVRARLAELQTQAADEAVLKKSDTLRQLRAVMCSDIRRLFTEDGRPKPPQELDADTAAALAIYKVDADGRVEVRFHPKINSIDMAAKMLGMYEKDNRQKADPLKELLGRLNGNVAGVSQDNSAREPEDDSA